MSTIVERVEREAGVPGLVSILAERLEPTDLQSLLLEVYRARAERRRPAAVLHEYETNRFVHPVAVAPDRLAGWERAALETLPECFEPIALSPLAPLGTVSVVAPLNQDWMVATERNTELVSDATNVLALECAVRRRALVRGDARSAEAVHLATNHRVVRAQRFEGPGMLSHFGLFALCSAGRDRGSHAFELEALVLHLSCHLRTVRAFVGPAVPLRVSVSVLGAHPNRGVVEERVCGSLRRDFDDGVVCTFDAERTQGQGYYRDVCLRIDARGPDGEWVHLADGGSVDWTQQLLSNSKERLFISGLGSERVCSVFD